MAKGLDAMSFEDRQQFLRRVVERITVENGVARIETGIPTGQDKLRNRYPEPAEGLLGRKAGRL